MPQRMRGETERESTRIIICLNDSDISL